MRSQLTELLMDPYCSCGVRDLLTTDFVFGPQTEYWKYLIKQILSITLSELGTGVAVIAEIILPASFSTSTHKNDLRINYLSYHVKKTSFKT